MAGGIPFRGGRTCECVATSLPFVEQDMIDQGVIKSRIDIFKYGYIENDCETDSRCTHLLGGNIDVGQYSTKAIEIWRDWGWTIQDRSPFFAQDHGHGWPYGCPHLSPAAQQQNRDWNRRLNGLANDGPVRGPWPVEHWRTAMERKLGATTLGVPLMTNAVPIRFDFDNDQLLTKDVEENVWVKEPTSTSIIAGDSTGIDIRATIAVSGLKEGESVRLWFHKQWKKTGEADVHKGSEDPVYIIHTPGVTAPSVHFTFAGLLAKADTGWTAAIRITAKTASETAVVTRRQIRGWKLEN